MRTVTGYQQDKTKRPNIYAGNISDADCNIWSTTFNALCDESGTENQLAKSVSVFGEL